MLMKWLVTVIVVILLVVAAYDGVHLKNWSEANFSLLSALIIMLAFIHDTPKAGELVEGELLDFQECVTSTPQSGQERDRLLADIDQLTVDNEELASKIHDLELAVRLRSS